MGVTVLELDPGRPFSAARARNEGRQVLARTYPEVEFVQFVDGDCELSPGWIEAGTQALRSEPALAVVFGRIRERSPEASSFNRLADIEWSVPPGPVDACGGVAMIRLAALDEVGGYSEDLIAGEEPELCLRVRRAGWKLRCLDRDMASHDLDMHHVGQWWRRTCRAGYAFAQGRARHGSGPERYYVGEVRRLVLWGGVLPAALIGAAIATQGFGLCLAALYLKPAFGAYRYARRRSAGGRHALQYAGWCTLGKFAEFCGWLRFQRDRRSGRQGRLIEHK